MPWWTDDEELSVCRSSKFVTPHATQSLITLEDPAYWSSSLVLSYEELNFGRCSKFVTPHKCLMMLVGSSLPDVIFGVKLVGRFSMDTCACGMDI